MNKQFIEREIRMTKGSKEEKLFNIIGTNVGIFLKNDFVKDNSLKNAYIL